MATSQLFKDYVVRYRKGDRIYSTGDPGTEMYIVQSGAVEIFREATGRRLGLAVMEKGDFFGEMALIESVPHANCAEALEDSDLIEINSTLFDRMIKGNIEIAVRMLRKLSIRLREATSGAEQAAPSPPVDVAPAPPADLQPTRRSETSPGSAMEEPAGEPAAPATEGAEPPVRAPASAEAIAQRPKGCHAVLLSEQGQEMFHIVSNRAAIGRFDPVTGLKPEVDLSALDLNRSVSRHHARLTLEGGMYSVTEEVGALNGTFINGRKLVSGKPSRIKSGDVLNLGMVKLFFQEIGPA
ncbi:MAG TPA: cyclic nucleotide-binding domain-containing protein [Candidatus Polarisedimenticolia bacterium]|jgi:pSer/pThr/pTyr-binding forkhead associated (FHA) protein